MAEAQAAPATSGWRGSHQVIVTGLVVASTQARIRSRWSTRPAARIRTLNVKDPQYQKLLGMIKVGDTITAVATEALVAAVEPAK